MNSRKVGIDKMGTHSPIVSCPLPLMERSASASLNMQKSKKRKQKKHKGNEAITVYKPVSMFVPDDRTAAVCRMIGSTGACRVWFYCL